MPETNPPPARQGLSRHILPNSGTMIGVATTLIGLVKIAEGRIGPSHVDEYAALAALVFLISAIASYISIRQSHHAKLSERLEVIADQSFLVGLAAISAIALLFAYEII
jgi:hypothetical protein